MTKVKLTKRLQALLAFVDQDQIVADIGTDHGTLPIACVLSNRCPFAYAVDNKEKPLSKAIKQIKDTNTQDKVMAILSDGYHPAFSQATTWVLAGLGFYTAKDILLDAFEQVKTLDAIILQVANHVEDLRRFCMQHHLHIIDETIIQENEHTYFIIKATYKPDDVFYNELEIQFGPINIQRKSTTFISYLQQTYQQKQLLLKAIPSSNPKRKQLEAECEQIKQLI